MRATIAVLIICTFFGSSAAFAKSAEDTARRFLTLVYNGRFEELPKAGQATTDAFERKVRNALRVRCIEVGAIDRKSVSAGGDAVAVELEVTLIKRARDTPEEWIETLPLRLKLVQNDAGWLVSSVEFPDDELAQQLIAASDEDQKRLLREHGDRIGKSLARAVYDRALALLNGAKFDDAKRAAALAREIAITAGDRGGEALALGVTMFAAVVVENWPEAERLSSESLSIAESVGDPDVLARVWYNRGRSLARVAADADERSQCYPKALRWAERAEDPDAADPRPVQPGQQCGRLVRRAYGTPLSRTHDPARS